MLEKKLQAAKEFANLHGYRLVKIQSTGQLAFKCHECDLLLPLRVSLPVGNTQTVKNAFFADHVTHAQTCALIPTIDG